MNDEHQPHTSVTDKAIEWLVQLHSGCASKQNFQAYHDWRAADPSHEASAQEAESLWQSLLQTRSAQHFRGTKPSRNNIHSLHPEATSLAGQRKFRHRHLFRSPMTWSVAACVAILVIAILPNFSFSPSADYQTAIGEHRAIILDDGSLLHLNTNTTVSVNYSPSTRELVLHKGEAFFQVQADPDRPFIVNTSQGHFQAVGTAFRIYRRESLDELVVTEGTVAVTRKGTPNQPVQVSAGQGVSLTANKPPQLATADPVEATAWQRDKLVFNRRPLAEVVEELNRYQPGFTVLMNDDVAKLEITGVFELDDIDAALKLMTDTLPIEITRLPYLTLVR